MGLGFLLLYVILNSELFMLWFETGMISRVVFYLAAGIAWLLTLFLDGEFMRTVYMQI